MKRIFTNFWRLANSHKAASARSSRKLGDEARDRGDWLTASAHYASHLQTQPDDFSIWVQKGHMSKEAGRLDDARAAYNAAAALQPNDADLLLHRAHLEKILGNLSAAAHLYLLSYSEDGNSSAASELASGLIFPHIDAQAWGKSKSPYRLVGNIEGLFGATLQGWALNPIDPHRRVDIELVVDDAVLATFSTEQPREDLAQIGYPDNIAGFCVNLSSLVDLGRGAHVALRLKDTGEPLLRSPFFAQTPALVRDWLSRHAGIQANEVVHLTEPFAHHASITFLMPVFNPRPDWLREALDSVLNQWCGQWRLICVNDGSDSVDTALILNQYSSKDSRISVIHLENNVGISTATNIAINESDTDYIAFIDQDDYLEPEAATRIIDAASTGPSIIYSDEIVTGEDINDLRFFSCRPAFSHDYYLSHPYFVHIVCVKRSVALDVGGYDESMNISADVDFILRVIEISESITHIPALLYRWRTHKGSTGHILAKEAAAASRRAIERHLERLGAGAIVESFPAHNAYVATYEPEAGSVITFQHGETPSNEHYDNSHYYLFLGEDIAEIDFTRMKGLCSRSDVGAVGATIVSTNGIVQHSGLIIQSSGVWTSSHKGELLWENGRRAGYNSSLISTRDYSAVSGECLMVPASIFHAAGGFDATLGPRLAAIDLCLKIRSLGYKVLNDGFTIARRQTSCNFPAETAEVQHVFHQRWGKAFAEGDPFYSPLLSPEGDYRPTGLDNLKAPARVTKRTRSFS